MIDQAMIRAQQDAIEHCQNIGLLTRDDTCEIRRFVDNSTNQFVLSGVRRRNFERLTLFWVRRTIYGDDIEVEYNPDAVPTQRGTPRPNSRLAAHEAHWSQS